MADVDLLVLGDCNPDLVVRGEDVTPVFGQVERLVDEANLTVGGSASIMACAAARLGLRTALVGVVGDDLLGRFMLDAVAGFGVDTSGCVIDPSRPTGLTVVLARGGGDRAMLTAPGTIDALTADMVDRDLLRSARHVHTTTFYMSSLAPDLPDLFAEAHRAGLTTSLDPQWDPSGRWDAGLIELLPSVDTFLPNAAEARSIAGIDDTDGATAMLAGHGPAVAVKLGTDGAMAISGGEVARSASPRVDAVDAIGAGDAFDAGFVAGRLAGWPLARALSLATACGALSTRAVGGTGALPSLSEAVEAMGGVNRIPADDEHTIVLAGTRSLVLARSSGRLTQSRACPRSS